MPTVLKSGKLKLLEPSGPVQACNAIALPLPLPLQLHSHTGLRGVRKDSFIPSPFLIGHISSENNFSCTEIFLHPYLPIRSVLWKLGHLWSCSWGEGSLKLKSDSRREFNPLKPELNSICYLLALLGAPHFLHVSRIRVKLLTFRQLMSYIYIYMEDPFLMFLDHTQRRSTVGRRPHTC